MIGLMTCWFEFGGVTGLVKFLIRKTMTWLSFIQCHDLLDTSVSGYMCVADFWDWENPAMIVGHRVVSKLVCTGCAGKTRTCQLSAKTANELQLTNVLFYYTCDSQPVISNNSPSPLLCSPPPIKRAPTTPPRQAKPNTHPTQPNTKTRDHNMLNHDKGQDFQIQIHRTSQNQ